MKNIIFIICSIGFLNIVKAQVTGTAYLQGQTDHSGIKVKFIANSPSAKTDSTITNSSGSYSKTIQGGVYKVVFSKVGFQALTYNNNTALVITSNQSLSGVTLNAGNFVDVSGNVSGLWLKGNTYIVKGDLTIPTGQALTIQPGTIVKFDGNYVLSVLGNLLAIGDVNDSITFTSNNSAPSFEDWKGIKIENTGALIPQIAYSKIEYCSSCFDISGSSVNINNNLIRKFKNAIYLEESSQINSNVSNNIISDSKQTQNAVGIYFTSFDFTNTKISCNRIYNISNCAICIDAGAGVEVSNNEIYNINAAKVPGEGAIYVSSSFVQIINNYIHDCSSVIYIGDGGNKPTIIGNTIINNQGSGIVFSSSIYSGIKYEDVKNNIIANNTIGIEVSDNSDYIRFDSSSHNLIFNNAEANLKGVQTAGFGTIINTDNKGTQTDGYYNIFSNPQFVANNSPFLSSNSPAFGAGENGSNIGADVSKLCFVTIPCSLAATLLSAPSITNQNNNLLASTSYSKTDYQWQINAQDEVGQTSATHTNGLLNTEYRVKASINGCTPVYSEPVSVFKNISLTTVTITEVITIANCNFRKGNQRVESTSGDSKLTLDVAAASIALNSNAEGVEKWEVQDIDQKPVTSLPPVSRLNFDALKPGFYYFKSIDKSGNLLKTYKLLLQ